MKWLLVAGVLLCSTGNAEELPKFEHFYRPWLLKQAVDGLVETAIEQHQDDPAKPDMAVIAVEKDIYPARALVVYLNYKLGLQAYLIIPGEDSIQFKKVDIGMTFEELVKFMGDLSGVEQDLENYRGGFNKLTHFYSLDRTSKLGELYYPNQNHAHFTRLMDELLYPDELQTEVSDPTNDLEQ